MSLISKKQRNFPSADSDALAGIAKALLSRLPSLASESTKNITKALHELLNGQDELSRKMRMGVQHYLIEVAEQQGKATPAPHTAIMMTTEAAAELMQCSRPYVAMLIDNKKLTGATVTEGGHRRVPESSVRAWIEERKAKASSSDYRAAAAETGIYAVSEEAFIETKTRRRL